MKIFCFHCPLEFSFAQAVGRGTWVPDTDVELCPECNSPQQRRVPPLIIEWLPGSDVIGDFTWLLGDVVVSQWVRDALENQFRGFEFKPIEMWQSPKLKRPQRVTKRSKPRVWLPYDGLALYHLWITTWVYAETERSTIHLIKDCSTCGFKAFRVDGIEEHRSEWDTSMRKLVEIHRLRVKGRGIYVRQEDIQGADIFCLQELPAWKLCTENVKRMLEGLGFNNVSFLEVGDII